MWLSPTDQSQISCEVESISTPSIIMDRNVCNPDNSSTVGEDIASSESTHQHEGMLDTFSEGAHYA